MHKDLLALYLHAEAGDGDQVICSPIKKNKKIKCIPTTSFWSPVTSQDNVIPLYRARHSSHGIMGGCHGILGGCHGILSGCIESSQCVSVVFSMWMIRKW